MYYYIHGIHTNIYIHIDRQISGGREGIIFMSSYTIYFIMKDYILQLYNL